MVSTFGETGLCRGLTPIFMRDAEYFEQLWVWEEPIITLLPESLRPQRRSTCVLEDFPLFHESNRFPHNPCTNKEQTRSRNVCGALRPAIRQMPSLRFQTGAWAAKGFNGMPWKPCARRCRTVPKCDFFALLSFDLAHLIASYRSPRPRNSPSTPCPRR